MLLLHRRGRIHSGNKPEDMERCILVGQTESKDFIGSSVAAFGPLFRTIQHALKTERGFIEITESDRKTHDSLREINNGFYDYRSSK